ncbi:MAG: hypothetical protein H7328_09670 [Bdellovibrio sp.]|nr:hypothetical protein [Bdellovibrio sp.]
MSHKTIAIVAVIMIFVFGTIVVVYPTMFQPAEANKTTAAPKPALPPSQNK